MRKIKAQKQKKAQKSNNFSMDNIYNSNHSNNNSIEYTQQNA